MCALRRKPQKKSTGCPRIARISLWPVAYFQTIFRFVKPVLIKSTRIRTAGRIVLWRTVFPHQPAITSVLNRSVCVICLHYILQFPVSMLEPCKQTGFVARLKCSEAKQEHAAVIAWMQHQRFYRIGVTVLYYDYAKRPTFYLMAHSRIDGLSHRGDFNLRVNRLFQNKETVPVKNRLGI